MIRATDFDKQDIIAELRKSIFNNVYLYIDILMYDFNSEFMKVWIHRNSGSIKQVILKYYNSFQIYSAEDYKDYSDIILLVQKYKPAMISGRADLIHTLYQKIAEQYVESYGVVLKQPYTGATCYAPEIAKIDDFKEIASLICSDEGIGGHYKVEELREQLISRFEDKMGRNYVFRSNQKIVAHYATYAEAPDVAVMGGLVVLPEYRGKGYAKALHCYLSDLLIKEKRDAILFCHNVDVLNMYLKFGAVICAEYGKLTLKLRGVVE